MKDFDLQLFAEENKEGEGDTSTSDADEKSANGSDSKKEDSLADIKATILELSKEIAGIKEFLTSPDFLSSVKSNGDEDNEEGDKKSTGDADADEKKLVTKIADQVALLIKKSEVERQIKKAKEVHSDFDDYKEQMIVISNASPDLSVEEVYQKAKKFKSFLEEDKKKTKTTPSFKPDTNTTSTSEKIPVDDVRSIVLATAKKLGLNL